MVIAHVSIKVHNALHAIFGNRTPEEQITFLRKLCDKDSVLYLGVYVVYKEAFDALFRGNISFDGMAEVLKDWDLSKESRERFADRLITLYRILNNEIAGGIPLRKFKLN